MGTKYESVDQAVPQQCSQPASLSVAGVGRNGLRLIVFLLGCARTDYAREGAERTDCRDYSPISWASGTVPTRIEILRLRKNHKK